MKESFEQAWKALREATGDAAYERYVEHRCRVHPGERIPSRREFYCERTEQKWEGVNRCC